MLDKSAKFVRTAFQSLGVDIRRYTPYPKDFGNDVIDLITQIRPYTMTSDERLFALRDAVRYVVENQIEGDFAECGVWRGGSMMAAALTLKQLGDTKRKIFLYDTFEGMSEPTENDVSVDGRTASDLMAVSSKDDGRSVWCVASLEDVKANLGSTGYPAERVVYVKGKVEDTIPAQVPEKIALLRLDTDWYESTKHGLEHLFPRLVPGGVLILDDYGHWQGARKAVDDYIRENKVKILLNRIDYTGRVGIKL